MRVRDDKKKHRRQLSDIYKVNCRLCGSSVSKRKYPIKSVTCYRLRPIIPIKKRYENRNRAPSPATINKRVTSCLSAQRELNICDEAAYVRLPNGLMVNSLSALGGVAPAFCWADHIMHDDFIIKSARETAAARRSILLKRYVRLSMLKTCWLLFGRVVYHIQQVA